MAADPTRAPRFSPGIDQASLAADYAKVGNAKPFTQDDLTKAYQPYDLKVGGRGKKTDAQLYKDSAKAVVSWWQKQQAEKASAEAQRRAASQARPAQPAPASTASPAPSASSFSQTRINSLLTQYGFGGARPPAYALRSEADLVAWLERAQRYAQAQAAAQARASVYARIPVLPPQPEQPTSSAPRRIATNRAPTIR